MDYVRLGKTGLEVSRVCLGCMTFGIPDRGPHPWTLGAEASRPIIQHALDLGINFFDTANIYSDGTSEEILGAALRDFAKRDEIVIATKVHGAMKKLPNSGGLSRKAIFHQIDSSLGRLGTDYVDLYQIHRWDYSTPIEETLEALHDVVKAGKARYIGASSMHAWQFAQAIYTADKLHLTRFVSMQNFLNLMYREEEREMLPFCKEEGIGVLPWSPLARGRLARPWNETSARSESDEFGKQLYAHVGASDQAVAQRVASIASERGVPMAQVALAWVMQKEPVTAPIVGASRAGHVDDAVAAMSLNLGQEEIEKLEEPYVPHSIVGFR